MTRSSVSRRCSTLTGRDLDGPQAVVEPLNAVVEPAHVGPYLGQVGPQVVEPGLGEGALAEDERPDGK